MNKIYAVYDLVAQTIVGRFLHLEKHDAAAIRMFTDAIANPQTDLHAHTADYNLICIGTVLENTDDAIFPVEIDPACRIVITGLSIQTMKQQENQNNAS